MKIKLFKTAAAVNVPVHAFIVPNCDDQELG